MFINSVCHHITHSQQQELLDLLNEYKDIFVSGSGH